MYVELIEGKLNHSLRKFLKIETNSFESGKNVLTLNSHALSVCSFLHEIWSTRFEQLVEGCWGLEVLQRLTVLSKFLVASRSVPPSIHEFGTVTYLRWDTELCLPWSIYQCRDCDCSMSFIVRHRYDAPGSQIFAHYLRHRMQSLLVQFLQRLIFFDNFFFWPFEGGSTVFFVKKHFLRNLCISTCC